MNLATLEIQLLADIARLRKDMDEAKGIVEKTSKAITNSINTAIGVLGALGLGLSIAAFSAWMKSAIDAGDAMKAFSQKTGVAVADVAGLQLAFQQGGVEGDKLQSAIAKMSKTMAEGGDSFQRLGIETRNADGSLRDAKSVLYDVADATAKMKDGTEKIVALQGIFGKSAADLIPTLNDGSQGLRDMADMAERLGLVMSADTADAADRFNDTTELLGMGLQGVSRQVMAELLPSLTNLAGVMLETASNGETVNQVAGAISGTFKALFSVGIGVSEVFGTLGNTLGATGAALMALMNGDFAAAKTIMAEWKQEVSTDWQESGAKIQKIWSDATDTTVVAMAEMNAAANQATSGIGKTSKAYDQYSQKLIQHWAQLEGEIEQNAKLTQSQKLLIDLTNKSSSAYKSLTETERTELIEKARQNVALEREALARAEARKQKEAEEKALVKLIEKTREGNRSLDEQIAAQRTANSAVRLGVDATAALEVAKLREMAATAQKNAIAAEEQQHNKNLAEQYQLQAEKLRELSDLKEQGIHIQAAKDAAEEWKKTTDSIKDGLTDSLMRGFEEGKNMADSFKDGLESSFKTLILKPTIQAVMGSVTNGVGSLFNSMGSMFGGQGGNGFFSTLGSFFGSGSTPGIAGGQGGMGSMMGGGSGMGALMSNPWTALIAAGMMMSDSAFAKGYNENTFSYTDAWFKTGGLAPVTMKADTKLLQELGLSQRTANVITGASLWSNAFGTGAKKSTESGFDLDITGSLIDGQMYSKWKKKGGWFSSSKHGTDYDTIDSELAAGLQETASGVYSNVEAYAKLLGLPFEQIQKVGLSARIKITEDETENQKAIDSFFNSYSNKLAETFEQTLKPLMTATEQFAGDYSGALARIGRAESASMVLNEFGGVFSKIATLSISAREQLFEFAGGIEALISKTQNFVGQYYSQDEQVGIQSRQLLEQFKALGIDAGDYQSKDQLRQLIESQSVATEDGRKMFAALLDLSASFASISGYLSEKNTTLGGAAAQAPEVAVLQSLFERQQDAAANSAAMVDRQDQTNTHLLSIDEGVRQGNSQIASAFTSAVSSITQSVVQTVIAQYSPSSRAVVEA